MKHAIELSFASAARQSSSRSAFVRRDPPDSLASADLTEKYSRAESSSLPLRAELELGGWRLVRHCPAGDHWYWANDHLRGTMIYGNPAGGDHPNAPQWSIRFDDADELLLTSGDGSKWIVIQTSDLKEIEVETLDSFSSMRYIRVTKSSINPWIHKVKVRARKTVSHNSNLNRSLQALHRSAKDTDPWISLVDHDEAKNKNNGQSFLYGKTTSCNKRCHHFLG